MTELVACTIVAHNYLPLARLVATSFLRHHPDARFVIAVIDRPIETRTMEPQPYELLPITDVDFGPEGFELMAAYYGVTEFATAVKPFVLRHVVRDADCALYLDPDIYVYAPLDPLVQATVDAGCSLTPHCLQPIERNGDGPTEREIMEAGVYNLGYIGVTPRRVDLLDWWGERLRRDAIIDPSNHLFTDQRWIDLSVPIFRPHIESSPAYNVAYWNLDQRHVWFDDDRPMVGDEPLRFLHFSGYDPKKPYWLSKYQPNSPRVLLSEQPALQRLCDDYGAELRTSAGPGPVAKYGWADICPGIPFEPDFRRWLRDQVMRAERVSEPLPPSPFRTGGLPAFVDWLRSTSPASQMHLPRYLEFLLASRPDLRGVYPESAHGDIRRLLRWARTSGRSEVPLIEFLGVDPDFAESGTEMKDVGREPGGVDLVGYLRAELGVGEAGRLLWSGLAAAGIPVETVACTVTLNRQEHPTLTSQTARHSTAVLAVNADQLPNVRRDLGEPFFSNRYVIGQWFWEVEQFPASYRDSFSLVDEVWTSTEHMRRAISAASPSVPVTLMPLPLVVPAVADMHRAEFGLDERFTFLFTFDMMSVFDRKNPLGLIEAFTSAFTPGEGPVLVLKTINGSRRREDHERLLHAIRNRPDIRVIDGYLDAAVAGALLKASDCYVSLHRAEGLGLTMSEAMCLGKPVIATDYSGNVDFMTEETAYLVPWSPVAIGKDAQPYPAEANWADPDLGVAARYMRQIVDDPATAAMVGEAARADLVARFSPDVVGAKMRRRLEQIWGTT